MRSSSRKLYANMTTRQRRATRTVARFTSVSVDALLSTTRGSPEEARARQLLMYAMYVFMERDYSFTEIGEALGRYRKTISHGVQATVLRAMDSPNWNQVVDNVRDHLR